MNTNDRAFYESMRSEGINTNQTFDVVLRELYAHFSKEIRAGNCETAWARRNDDPIHWRAALAHYVAATAWAHLYLATSGTCKATAAGTPQLREFVARHEAFLVEYAELNERIGTTIADKAMADAIGD